MKVVKDLKKKKTPAIFKILSTVQSQRQKLLTVGKIRVLIFRILFIKEYF